MSWVDWAIVIVLAASLIGGIVAGFFRTACSLLGLLFGYAVAVWNYRRVASFLVPVIRIETIANVIAFLLLAVLVMVIFRIVGILLGRAFHWLGLGCLDRLAGGLLGIIKGGVMVIIAVQLAVAFFPRAHWLADSRLPKRLFGTLHMSTKVTPAELAERLRKGLRLLEQESPSWMHPEEPST